jgi:3-dehydroquinate synthase
MNLYDEFEAVSSILLREYHLKLSAFFRFTYRVAYGSNAGRTGDSIMKKLHIHGKTGDSALLVGENLDQLEHLISGRRAVIITDNHVEALYRKDFPDCPVITIGCGEGIKTLNTVHDIYQHLVELEADRSTFIVGIGGGIVCDITGFVASTYMRGVSFGFVASSLLAQVDASVGGKNGVNFGGYKNMVGVFNQPEFVICDMNLLHTLPRQELLCGFAEIVKHAVIADEKMFAFLEDHWQDALALDHDVIERLVYDSVVIKSGVVNRDETEKGERRILNFGHTVGHAIEKTIGIAHGEAVSIGMVAAAGIARNLEMFSETDMQRIVRLLTHFNLPVRLGAAHRDAVFDAMRKDKKREGDGIFFVLLPRIGAATVRSLSIVEIRRLACELFTRAS